MIKYVIISLEITKEIKAMLEMVFEFDPGVLVEFLNPALSIASR